MHIEILLTGPMIKAKCDEHGWYTVCTNEERSEFFKRWKVGGFLTVDELVYELAQNVVDHSSPILISKEMDEWKFKNAATMVAQHLAIGAGIAIKEDDAEEVQDEEAPGNI